LKTVGIPLILTFKLDSDSQQRLDRWRGAHFPKDRNFLKAHLTIYHQLPGQMLKGIQESLTTFVKSHAVIPLRFDRLMMRQGFVGVGVTSEEMLIYKSELNALFHADLRAQDRQPYRPHVTVTNKGSPREAENVFRQLEAEFEPWDGQILALELYHYRGGPWELADIFEFSGDQPEV
jgi:2'-5' RNA ligase